MLYCRLVLKIGGMSIINWSALNLVGFAPLLIPDFGVFGLSPKGTLLAFLDVPVLLNVLPFLKSPELVNLGVDTLRWPLLIIGPSNVPVRRTFSIVAFAPLVFLRCHQHPNFLSAFSIKGDNPLWLVLKDIQFATLSSAALYATKDAGVFVFTKMYKFASIFVTVSKSCL